MAWTTKVLLVEDDPPSALYAKTVLDAAGCSVRHVSDGIEATEFAVQSRFDLILLDFHLPNRKGPDIARLIRIAEAINRRTPTPIVGITARAMPDEVQAFLGAGLDEVVTKPLSIEQLHSVLRRWAP